MSALLDDSVNRQRSRKHAGDGDEPKTAGKSYKSKAYRWNREKYSRQRRFFDIWAFVLLWLASLWLDSKNWSYWGGVSEEKKVARRRFQAIWVRETLLDLGPTFIKVGQLFSTRADLFPTEFVEELSKLQDKVPAFSYEQLELIVEQDLGKTVQELYHSFDPVPWPRQVWVRYTKLNCIRARKWWSRCSDRGCGSCSRSICKFLRELLATFKTILSGARPRLDGDL